MVQANYPFCVRNFKIRIHTKLSALDLSSIMYTAAALLRTKLRQW